MLSEVEVLDIYRQTGAILEGHFLLTSGLHSPTYLQCARVLQYPWHAEKLCAQLAADFGDMNIELVAAPAVGGIVVAHEVARALKVPAIFVERQDGKLTLRRGFEVTPGTRVLVVEDVVTTGGSTRETIDVITALGGNVVAAASLINRSGGSADIGVPMKSLVTLTVNTYAPETCPLCAAGSAPVKPGSRGLK
ncbi:MAG: orotate phosphoribosyltransferase [Nitrospirota bacterium]|nr:orotate phosphoribosyltransferase [Nitrospirota bacterium]